MADPSVTAQNTRIDTADSTSTTSNIGGGSGPGGEPDILYQGSGGTPEDVSRKVGTSLAGFSIDTTITDISTSTGTYQTLMMKYNAANFAALELASVPGVELRLGSGSTAYALYDLEGSDTYKAKGGFIIRAIDPNITGYRTSTSGSPNYASADYFAIACDFTATSKSENVILSAIDVGAGLTLVGGDGASPDAQWSDFFDFDEGTLANRYGYFTALEGFEGIYAVFGTMVIGSATETDFTDSGVVTIFPDGFFEAGWSGVEVNLSNSNSVFNNTNHTYDSRGNTTTTDSRAVYNVTGTSGTGTETNITIKSFAEINLNSAMTFDGGLALNCGPIDVNGGSINGLNVNESTVAANTSAIIYNVNADPDGELDDLTVTKGTNNHHAIEFGLTSPTVMTIRNMTNSGFSATNGDNNSTFHVLRTSGTVTINVIGGSGNFTYLSEGAIVDIVQDPVTTEITTVQSDGTAIQDVRVLLRASDGTGDLPFEDSVSITRSGSTASVSHTAHGMVSGNKVQISGANQQEYNGVKTISNVTTNAYDFTVTGTPTTPATGTIIATGVVLEGNTNVSGVISESRTWSTDQPVTGFARKSTTSPFFKTAPINATISSSSGLSQSAVLISDE